MARKTTKARLLKKRAFPFSERTSENIFVKLTPGLLADAQLSRSAGV
jgi:hypothetical protein